MRQIGYATAPPAIGETSSANRIQNPLRPVTSSYCPQIGGLMRLIVNVFPDGTGRLIFASNAGSTGTMGMPHTILAPGRAMNSMALARWTFASVCCVGASGLSGGDGANNFENGPETL